MHLCLDKYSGWGEDFIKFNERLEELGKEGWQFVFKNHFSQAQKNVSHCGTIPEYAFFMREIK